ncbi:hypothetical protein DER46DRAFT_628550 [Fusarium sp. MPI-SDFR-AT-0072]|nr:hypothetical protein DER46DRAFT_628550 [Fusarium sp. MPI-SDFR-AT-0072]
MDLIVLFYKDNTCTSTRGNPANNNRFILQPIQPNNMPGNNSALLVREAAGFTNPLPQAILTGQENINTIQPAPMLFDHNAWFAQNTTPGAPTTVASLTPQQLQAAQNHSTGCILQI